MEKRVCLADGEIELAASEKIVRDFFGVGPSDRFVLSCDPVSAVYFACYIDYVRQTGRNQIVATDLAFFEKVDCVVKRLGEGQITRKMVEELLTARTALVSLPWANKRTGVVNPILDIAELCKEKGVLLHVDAAEVVGKLYFRFQDLNVDFLTFKGGLFVKAEAPFTPATSGDATFLSSLHEGILRASSDFDYMCTETARLREKLERGQEVLFANLERLPIFRPCVFPVFMRKRWHFYYLGRALRLIVWMRMSLALFCLRIRQKKISIM